MTPEIKSIIDLFNKNLSIPNYQRPYKWTNKNIEDLLTDIEQAIIDYSHYKDFRYRRDSRWESTPHISYSIILIISFGNRIKKLISPLNSAILSNIGILATLLENRSKNGKNQKEALLTGSGTCALSPATSIPSSRTWILYQRKTHTRR